MPTLRRSVAAALITATLVWLIFDRSREQRKAGGAPPSIPPKVAPGSPATPSPPSAVSHPDPARPEPPPFDPAALRPPPLELATGLLPWEKQIAEAVSRSRDAKSKAREILALLPRLPAEALATAAEQAVERLPDADYAATALPALTNPQTDGQVLSVLFADLMERPDAITLPALLTIAQNPAHPFAPAALDNLRLLLRAEFGSEWSKWREAVNAALAPK